MGDDFKHITVTAAEDDEVIVAGVVDGAEPATEPASAPEPETEPTPEPALASEPASAPKKAPKPTSSPAPVREDTYHETTLEDLEGSKMPLAQKIVIVAAVICIIGALVYYFVAMR